MGVVSNGMNDRAAAITRAFLTVAYVIAGTIAAPIHARPARPAVPALLSPWDSSRRPSGSDRRYTCPTDAPPAAVFSLTGYYNDASHSVIDPAAKRAYERASARNEAYL